jgi:hypothetical protein
MEKKVQVPTAGLFMRYCGNLLIIKILKELEPGIET